MSRILYKQKDADDFIQDLGPNEYIVVIRYEPIQGTLVMIDRLDHELEEIFNLRKVMARRLQLANVKSDDQVVEALRRTVKHMGHLNIVIHDLLMEDLSVEQIRNRFRRGL